MCAESVLWTEFRLWTDFGGNVPSHVGDGYKTAPPMANLTVVPRPHWVNAWLLRAAARPYLRLDGAEHPLAWGQAHRLPLAPGTHVLQTFWRYRGFGSALGTGTLQLTVRTGADVLVLARNGPLNHQPLQPRQVDELAAGS